MIPFQKRAVFVLFTIVALVIGVTSNAPAQEGRKVALVIGNGNYTDLGRLNNPPNDARDIAAALERIGFEVDTVIDGSLRQMEQAVLRMSDRLSSSADTTGFFFYAGHAVQSDGSNYLIPAGASIPSADFLSERALSAQVVLNIMQRAGNSLNVVVLDACRDNPFSWSRSGTRGLSAISSQPPGSIVAYATSAGSVAQDGTGRNGVFTAELLRHIDEPGLDIKEVFNRTGRGVMEATGNRQIPAVYSQFFDTAYLAGAGTSGGTRGTTPVSLPERPDTSRPLRNEIFIQGGTFRMGSTTGDDAEAPVHTVRLDDFFMMPTEVIFADYDAFARAVGRSLPDDQGWGRGTRPVINVSWYDAVAYANWLSERDGFAPAYRINGTNVTWNQNAGGWRLPTEAEWEYAARGGREAQNTTYAGTNTSIQLARYANFADRNTDYNWSDDSQDDGYQYTAPVGSYRANELGLYDMSGNVWEWCWDWYGSYSSGTQTNPSGPASGSSRVLRGGSWYDVAPGARVAARIYLVPGYGYYFLGFRLVRPSSR